jgi:hypothetical protein
MAAKPTSPDTLQAAVDALAMCNGNQSHAAEMLGIKRPTFVSQIRVAQHEGYRPNVTPTGWTFPKEYPLEIDSGTIVVFSDAHYQPGPASLAHRALLEVVKQVKPRAIIIMGLDWD